MALIHAIVIFISIAIPYDITAPIPNTFNANNTHNISNWGNGVNEPRGNWGYLNHIFAEGQYAFPVNMRVPNLHKIFTK